MDYLYNRNNRWSFNANNGNNNNNNNSNHNSNNINNNANGNNNNGFLMDHQRPNTPGNLSVLSTVSGQVAARRRSENGGLNSSRNKPIPLHASTFVGIQSKFRRKYYHKTILSALVLLIIILLITIIVLSVSHKKLDTTCRSKECVRTAATLLYSMDKETDPCEDFYKFTCGNWADEHPRPDSVTSNDWFRERQAQVMRIVRDFLRSNVTSKEPEAVGKVKKMYTACMDTALLDKRDLEPLVNFMREFKLPILPSALNITLSAEAQAKHNKSVEFNWLESLVLIKKYLGMDLIVGFDIFPDPLNRTLNRIALGTPETDSALPFNDDEIHKLLRKIRRKAIANQNDDNNDVDDREDDEEEEARQSGSGFIAYIAYIKKVIEMYVDYLEPEADSELSVDSLSTMVMDAVKFAREMYRLKDEVENSTKTTSKNPIEDIVYISVVDLQNQTDKLIAPKTLPMWEHYLQLIMKDANHSQKFRTDDLKIITSNADILYLQLIVEYLQDVPTSHIESYIWLSAVEEMILHTTSSMRLLHSEYMKIIIGTEGSSPRSLYCAHGVNSLMGMAVSYAMVDEEFTRHQLPQVQRMLSNIRRSFDSLVRATSWMDEATKHETLKKSAEMQSFIGFPDWISNFTELNAHYAGVHVNESLHLENMIGVLRWNMQNKLDNLYKPEPVGWATSPSNVNAFHTFQSNAITIPIAILQYPFYNLGLEALNYGAIGTILGHELTHGFDDSGRMFDRYGNMVQWWSNETINEYINRTECFVDQYNHYYLDDIGEYIDGELTLGENIADNGGMREAFYAYRMFVRESGKERQQLPGLEKYSHEQLFFISFGNLWCETYTAAASQYALEDSHCPGKIRLKGVLSNSQEFAQTFKCRHGSGMNPVERKCRIW